jgi:hypothetical protein
MVAVHFRYIVTVPDRIPRSTSPASHLLAVRVRYANQELSMNTGRILLAGLLGGIAMFAWTSLAHMALPLGSTGVREIPNNEPAVLAQMHDAMGDTSGLYLYPSLGWKPGQSSDARAAAMKNYDAKLATNPSGLLIYHAPGRKSFEPRLILTEFVTELIEALLAVFLLSQTQLSSFAARAGFVLVVGILAALPTNISYWNWYGFPGDYTAAYMFTQIVGFLCVGLVAAALTRRRVRESVPVAAS